MNESKCALPCKEISVLKTGMTGGVLTVVTTIFLPIGLLPWTATTWPGKKENSLRWETSRATLCPDEISLLPSNSIEEVFNREPLVASQQIRPIVWNVSWKHFYIVIWYITRLSLLKTTVLIALFDSKSSILNFSDIRIPMLFICSSRTSYLSLNRLNM